MPKFGKYDGHGDPVAYLRQYCNELRGAGGKEELLMAYFGESLSGKPFIEVLKMGEMIEDGIKTGRIGIITPLLRYTPGPHLRSCDPNVRCAYHSDVHGHSIEDCRALKREIEKMIQDKSIMVQNINSEEISIHADMQTSGEDVRLSN
ncbi:hypothetical protein FXO37_34588 [Capsicum annuum]|nr:hypothetical protein FXO37_34588 [Capsicum annuum]